MLEKFIFNLKSSIKIVKLIRFRIEAVNKKATKLLRTCGFAIYDIRFDIFKVSLCVLGHNQPSIQYHMHL